MNERVIDLLESQLESAPSDWGLILPLFEMYYSGGMQEKAAELLERAEEEPSSGTVELLFQAVESSKQDSPRAALLLLDKLTKIDRANAQAYLLKAEVFLELGEKEAAKKNYSVATVIDESLECAEFEASLEHIEKVPSEEASTQDRQQVALGLSHTERNEVDIPSREEVSFGDDFSEEDLLETDRLLDGLVDTAETVDFSDIGGMDALKERIRMSIIYPFQNKELFAKFKKKTGGGILLYGPPGCGKTFISKATAGECGAHFMNISIHDILSKWIGEAEQRVHQLFEVARRKSPTIIFIDEIDALCVKRSDAGNSASLVNALLTEIDGATSNNEDVLVLGATNTPWRIDSAFRRPGRFDHVLFVPPPDQLAREAIFKLALEGIPQERIKFDKLSKLSNQFSGADLVACVQSASESVLESIMKQGKEVKLTEKMLLQAVKKHRPTTTEWLEQASNYASYANQSGLYDDLADFLKS